MNIALADPKLAPAEFPRALDIEALRTQFPILRQRVHGKPLVYLDNAASVQKPQVVIDAITECYSGYYANIHRAVHHLSERSTAAYDGARDKVQGFLNAKSPREIVFTRGTTESINLVAQSFLRPKLQPGDEILITEMEHHANIVPWQLVAEATGAKVVALPISDAGELGMAALDDYLTERVKLVAVVHVSNALGTINPVAEIIQKAHAKGIPVLVDGAQSAPHMQVDVAALDCDFYTFSGHKTYGPSGIGVLYGKEGHLEAKPPYQGGGDMIDVVTIERSTYADLPQKFEAGTPHISGAIGLGVALDWMQATGVDAIAAHEDNLLTYATERLSEVEGLRLIGTAPHKAAVASFVVDGLHPQDLGTLLDQLGVAVRTGHHCAQPVMQHFGVSATVRASFAAYNTRAEVDALVDGLQQVRTMLV
ncbi:MAG: aminotransferase class V-fold PLP-dependent enzyme [Candidatus Competibacterales bacterium]